MVEPISLDPHILCKLVAQLVLQRVEHLSGALTSWFVVLNCGLCNECARLIVGEVRGYPGGVTPGARQAVGKLFQLSGKFIADGILGALQRGLDSGEKL